MPPLLTMPIMHPVHVPPGYAVLSVPVGMYSMLEEVASRDNAPCFIGVDSTKLYDVLTFIKWAESNNTCMINIPTEVYSAVDAFVRWLISPRTDPLPDFRFLYQMCHGITPPNDSMHGYVDASVYTADGITDVDAPYTQIACIPCDTHLQTPEHTPEIHATSPCMMTKIPEFHLSPKVIKHIGVQACIDILTSKKFVSAFTQTMQSVAVQSVAVQSVDVIPSVTTRSVTTSTYVTKNTYTQTSMEDLSVYIGKRLEDIESRLNDKYRSEIQSMRDAYEQKMTVIRNLHADTRKQLEESQAESNALQLRANNLTDELTFKRMEYDMKKEKLEHMMRASAKRTTELQEQASAHITKNQSDFKYHQVLQQKLIDDVSVIRRWIIDAMKECPSPVLSIILHQINNKYDMSSMEVTLSEMPGTFMDYIDRMFAPIFGDAYCNDAYCNDVRVDDVRVDDVRVDIVRNELIGNIFAPMSRKYTYRPKGESRCIKIMFMTYTECLYEEFLDKSALVPTKIMMYDHHDVLIIPSTLSTCDQYDDNYQQFHMFYAAAFTSAVFPLFRRSHDVRMRAEILMILENAYTLMMCDIIWRFRDGKQHDIPTDGPVSTDEPLFADGHINPHIKYKDILIALKAAVSNPFIITNRGVVCANVIYQKFKRIGNVDILHIDMQKSQLIKFLIATCNWMIISCYWALKQIRPHTTVCAGENAHYMANKLCDTWLKMYLDIELKILTGSDMPYMSWLRWHYNPIVPSNIFTYEPYSGYPISVYEIKKILPRYGGEKWTRGNTGSMTISDGDTSNAPISDDDISNAPISDGDMLIRLLVKVVLSVLYLMRPYFQRAAFMNSVSMYNLTDIITSDINTTAEVSVLDIHGNTCKRTRKTISSGDHFYIRGPFEGTRRKFEYLRVVFIKNTYTMLKNCAKKELDMDLSDEDTMILINAFMISVLASVTFSKDSDVATVN